MVSAILFSPLKLVVKAKWVNGSRFLRSVIEFTLIWKGNMNRKSITETEVNIIGAHITSRIGELLLEGTVTLEQSDEIGQDLVAGIFEPQTLAGMAVFVDSLNDKWPYFDAIQSIVRAPMLFVEEFPEEVDLGELPTYTYLGVRLHRYGSFYPGGDRVKEILSYYGYWPDSMIAPPHTEESLNRARDYEASLSHACAAIESSALLSAFEILEGIIDTDPQDAYPYLLRVLCSHLDVFSLRPSVEAVADMRQAYVIDSKLTQVFADIYKKRKQYTEEQLVKRLLQALDRERNKADLPVTREEELPHTKARKEPSKGSNETYGIPKDLESNLRFGLGAYFAVSKNWHELTVGQRRELYQSAQSHLGKAFRLDPNGYNGAVAAFYRARMLAEKPKFGFGKLTDAEFNRLTSYLDHVITTNPALPVVRTVSRGDPAKVRLSSPTLELFSLPETYYWRGYAFLRSTKPDGNTRALSDLIQGLTVLNGLFDHHGKQAHNHLMLAVAYINQYGEAPETWAAVLPHLERAWQLHNWKMFDSLSLENEFLCQVLLEGARLREPQAQKQNTLANMLKGKATQVLNLVTRPHSRIVK